MEMEERPLLRVEDALMYLDQVKVEFGDRPQIYNEFLDIMKTFKTQQIDTPGVIRRVSNLFQGNRRLVLGFNTFLPDGYRIEVPPDGIGPPVAVYRAPGSDAVHILRESPESEAVSVSQVAAAAAAAQQQGLPPPSMNRLPPQGHPPVPPIQPRVNPILPQDAGGVAPRVARSGDAPRPPTNAGPPSRIQQALPGGVAPRQPAPTGNRPQASPPINPAGAPPPPPPPPAPQNGQRQASGGGQQQSSPAKAPAEGNGNGHLEFDHAINYVTAIKRRFSDDPGTYKKFLEILHTYQKEQRGIKEILEEVSELFEDHPDLLREFTFFLPDAVQNQAKVQLDQLAKEAEERKRSRAQAAIMNTAQNMRQVPPVRNTSVGAASTAEPEVAVLNGRSQPTQYKLTEREIAICREAQHGIVRFESARPPRKHMPTVPVAAQKNGRPRSIPLESIVVSVAESKFFQDVQAHLSRKELQTEKPTTGNKIHTPYVEFLKHLHLFGAGFLSKEELLQLLKPFFYCGHSGRSGAGKDDLGTENATLKANADRLMKLLERIMIDRGPYGRQQKSAALKTPYGHVCRRMMKFTACSNPTPSYRPYPPDFPHSVLGKCEGKSAADAEVLNDNLLCISPELVRVGEMESRYIHKKRKADSIEESNASKRRHNTYEDNLFRIEDERFELDMAIERNLHALRKVEPLATEVQKLSAKEEKDGQPIGRLRYQLKSNTLNSLHIGAIGRIYGDRAEEILQYLAKNPLVALPVIHKRLKAKSEEWKRAKEKLDQAWKEERDLNYAGSFDVKCYFYRRALEKFSSVHRLVDHCKKVRTFINHPEKLKISNATEPFVPSFHKWNPDRGSLFYQPYLECKCTPDESHKLAFQLVSHCIKSSSAVSAFDRECIGRIWSEFVLPWFKYPTSWLASEIRESFTGKVGAGVALFACGQTVVTIFGEGTVAAFNAATDIAGPSYRVRLRQGLALLSPSAILYAKPSLDNPHVRSDGLMVRDTSTVDVDNGGARLDEKNQILFCTETTYVFIRLYSLLCSVLKKSLECHRQLDTQLSHSKPTGECSSDEKLYFSNVITMTKEVVARRAEVAELETLGRKICKENVHLIGCLPKLVERCADALLKVSEEDTLLHLYDFCQYKSPDVAALRARCLTAVPDATYRIQYVAANSSLLFGHQEIGPFPTQPPPEDDFVDEDTNMDTGDDMDEDVEFDAQEDGAATPEDVDVNEEPAEMTGEEAQ